MSIRLRLAAPEDVEQLGALKLRASLAWGDHIAQIAALPEARAFAPEHLPFATVAEAQARVVGFVTVLAGGDAGAELEDLFVDPDCWRRGIGRALVAEAVQRARDAGADVLRVVANRRALEFYRACGFGVVGEVQTLFEPALEMNKRLDLAS